MTGAFRLPRGGRIDRARTLSITFEGRRLAGFAGDTVASILLAHGVNPVARSFKYHRPRGIMTHGSDEPSALVTVDRGPGRVDPNNRAPVVEARDGLAVTAQHCWPSLGFDLGAVNDLIAPAIPAGFYYKTFIGPEGAWTKLYEPLIRRAAGLGRAPSAPDPDRYAHRHAHCDVLVVGAGPAGLAAALAASKSGRRVILVDEQGEPGGSLLHDLTSVIAGRPAQAWLAETLAALEAGENLILLPRTTAFGYYNHNHLALVERLSDHLADAPAGLPRERLWQVRAGEVVLATGAHERPLVFPDNDRPGIMLAESLRAFVNRWAVAPGRRIVIATTGASAYRAALDATAAGLDASLVDLRLEADIGPELAEARAAGIAVHAGHTVVGSTGRNRVTGLIVAPIGSEGRIGPRRTLPCDAVGMSGGWTPAVHLVSQSRGKLIFDAGLDAFVPGEPAQAARWAGACRGAYDLAACLRDGWEAGQSSLRPADEARSAVSENARRRGASFETPAVRSPQVDEGSGLQSFEASPSFTGFLPVRTMPSDRDLAAAKAFVDFQNDVTVKDLKLAVREGFTSIEHVKRYTTTGMATDQGKTSNMNALGIVAGILEKPLPAVGTTTFRPPYTPVTFGALVGPAKEALFDPVRTTPIHAWAVEHGAAFEEVGLWRRAWYFPRDGEGKAEAVARECAAVRRGVGLFDASTLGKIEVVGPDAAEFLNRLYVNDWLRLEPGRCRYGLMLKEDGYVLDDGVVGRLAADRFHVTTTTGGAARVLAHMEDYLQTEWPELDVYLTSVTEQWAVIAVQGPRARDLIAPFVAGVDLSSEAFPHMAVRTGTVCGVPARLFRVSFTGELGFEINVPSRFGLQVWETLWERGRSFGAVSYGTETMHVLRAEKGYIIVGQETDGTVTPDDLGLGGLVSRRKRDFVGKRSLARPDLAGGGRKQLVGLATSGTLLDEGAQIVADPGAARPVPMLGHVTSSYWSPTLGRPIALALVKDGRARTGATLHATTPEGFTAVTVSGPVFLDPEGGRLRG